MRASADKRITYAGDGTPLEMPWIFDFRAIMLEAKWLDTYAELFWGRFAHKYPFQVGGLETAAIALVAAVVMKGNERGTPVNGFFIRKSRKREGLMKQIEGTLTEDPIILVDDLINTGSSLRRLLLVHESLEKHVSDMFVILSFRAMDAYAFAAEKGTTVSSLFALTDFGMAMMPTHAPEIPRAAFVEAWKFSPGGAGFEYVVQKSAPIADDTCVYFGTDSGTFFAVHQKDGSVAWRFDIGKHPSHKGIFSSPALYNGVVYFGAYDGNVYALNSENGAEIWKNSDADWIGSSPAIAPDLGLLFIGLEFGIFRKRGGIAALDLKTGVRRWTDRTPALTHGSPLYIREENMVVIGSNDGVVYAYEAASGRRLWTFQTSGDVKTRPAYDAPRRQIIVPSMDTRVYALAAHSGAVQWALETGGPIYSNPLVVGDVAYITSLDKSLYAIDCASGNKLWEFATNGRIFATPVVAEGSLWIGSNDGRLYEIDPESGKLRTFHQLTERIVNAIAWNPVAKALFVPTVANELYCIHKKTEGSATSPSPLSSD